MWINGEESDSIGGERMWTVSPAHDKQVASYPLADAADVDRAVRAAREAFDQGPWPSMMGRRRSRALEQVADLIQKNIDSLARLETLESGKPISQAVEEMKAAVDLWRYAATLARHVHGDSYNSLGENKLGFVLREPVGVVAMITPWNFPLLIVSQKLPFALAAGCTAVIKPSELTPGTTLRLAELTTEAGIPPGVVNVVNGYGSPVGSHLASHSEINFMSFTGSTAVGRSVAAAAGQNLKGVSLELGGKNPNIVFADADMDAAVDAAVFGVYFNMGECCNSGSRLLVESGVADEFTRRIVEKARTIPVGDPLDPATKVGAIINEEQLSRIKGYIRSGRQCEARLLLGGGVMPTEHGRFVEPTIFDRVTAEMPIAREEIFGPVLSVLTFDTRAEAIALANDTCYGLSAGVWTRDVETAFEISQRVRAGTIWINCFMDGYPELPFGGYHDSGLGRELGRFSLDEFTELKTIQLHLGSRGTPWV
ncbi:MAG: aldehyde dehydrogenase family protein [Bacteroidota bacterium]|nr:aldehyde dehydrogenase family protein [Bacteroidota bacterium]MDE2834720.1 aldehyde dehydrogenase family protein [Bacteroidota bacterium]